MINKMRPGSGRMLKENNEWVNAANPLSFIARARWQSSYRRYYREHIIATRKFIAIQVLKDARFETLDGNMQGNRYQAWNFQQERFYMEGSQR